MRKTRLSIAVFLTIVTVMAFYGTVLASGISGVYAGGHETTAGMGGKVSYHYFIDFQADGNYIIKSYFIMGDALYDYVEKGTYSVSGKELTIIPDDGEVVTGSVNEDDSVSISIKPSMMAPKRTDVVLAPSANTVAGVYTATLQGPSVIEATLFLTHTGEYYYLAVPDNDAEAVQETGTYMMAGDEITFVLAETGEVVDGVVKDGEIEAPFVVSVVMGMRMGITLSF